MIISVGALLLWFGWLCIMAGLLIWAVLDFRRTHTWYVGFIGIGSALHIAAMASVAVGSIPFGRLFGLPAPLTSLHGSLWWLVGGWSDYAFLLGTPLLIIGGLAFYVAYPRLDVQDAGRDGESNGGDG